MLIWDKLASYPGFHQVIPKRAMYQYQVLGPPLFKRDLVAQPDLKQHDILDYLSTLQSCTWITREFMLFWFFTIFFCILTKFWFQIQFFLKVTDWFAQNNLLYDEVLTKYTMFYSTIKKSWFTVTLVFLVYLRNVSCSCWIVQAKSNAQKDWGRMTSIPFLISTGGLVRMGAALPKNG